MIRLTKAADYGIVLLTAMARGEEALHTAAGLSAANHLPQPTAAKVLKLLARHGLVESERGVHGGYRLARSADQISVADAIRAVDGPIAVTECVDETPGLCSVESDCSMRSNWERINTAIEAALDAVSIAEMAVTSASGLGDELVQLGESAVESAQTTQGQPHAH